VGFESGYHLRIVAAGDSSREIGKSKPDLCISLEEIGKWAGDLCISLEEIHISAREIGISRREICRFFFPTTQGKLASDD